MKTSLIQIPSKVRLLVAAILTVSLLPLVASGQGLNDIQWLSDVERAKQIAKQQDKMVLLHFDATWCRPCKALETYVFKSGAVKKAIAENVVPVRLDADTALHLVNEYDVSVVPFDVIISPGGRVVTERRSPADAENYAKMINGVASASRLLDKEKRGPIAHQRKIVKNRLAGQNPASFRVTGPEPVEFGLSKDATQLQRRQAAFDQSEAVRKTNPFMNAGLQSDPAPVETAQPMRTEEAVSVADLQRNEFLSRERTWSAPSQETRRAKPERIVNERYFEKLSKKDVPQDRTAAMQNQFAMPEAQSLQQSMPQISTQPSSQFAPTTEPASQPMQPAPIELPMENSVSSSMANPLLDSPTTDTDLDEPEIGIESGHGEFKLPQPTAPSRAVVDVSNQSHDLLDLQPATPEIVKEKFCLKGKCPVTLITEGRWADGDANFGIVHRNRTYIFATAEKLALFKTDPDKYSPILAGYDPVVYHKESKLVDGLAENGVFMGQAPNQKVILFSNDETRAEFQSKPELYLETIRIATMNTRTRANRKVR